MSSPRRRIRAASGGGHPGDIPWGSALSPACQAAKASGQAGAATRRGKLGGKVSVGVSRLPGYEAASLIDNPKAGIVRRAVPAVLASVDPAVDHRVTLAGFVTDARAAPEGHDDLARTPRMPLRAGGRVWPPDRKVVRQVAVVHRPIRTHGPSRHHTGQERPKEA